MNINVENLISMVQEHFENTQIYHKKRLECWEKQNGNLRKLGCTPKNCTLYVDRLEGNDAVSFAKYWERAEHGERVISNFCNALGIDQQKLYAMVRSILKWHNERDWQVCFPFTDKISNKILNYIQV